MISTKMSNSISICILFGSFLWPSYTQGFISPQDFHLPALVSQTGVTKPYRNAQLTKDEAKFEDAVDVQGRQYFSTEDATNIDPWEERELAADQTFPEEGNAVGNFNDQYFLGELDTPLGEVDLNKGASTVSRNMRQRKFEEVGVAALQQHLGPYGQARDVRFSDVFREYQHAGGKPGQPGVGGGPGLRGQVSRFGDIHTTHAVLHQLAPDHKREYFKYVDQLARAGLQKHQFSAPRPTHREDHPATIPKMTKEQHAALPRSTRDYIRHQGKLESSPDKVARWEALNAKALNKGWFDANNRARSKGYHVDDSVTRRHISG